MGSRSRSTTQQRQNSEDNRSQIGLDNTTGSNVAMGGSTINVSSTDYGALELADGIAGESIELAGGALTLTDRSSQRGAELAGGAIEISANLASDLTGKALSFADEESDDALQFGAYALDAAVGLADNSFALVNESTQSALLESRLARQDALNESNSARQDALAFGARSAADAYGFSAGAFSKAIDEISDNSYNAFDAIGKANEQSAAVQSSAINQVAAATRSESAGAIDQVVKVTMFVVAGFALVTVFRK